MFEIMLFWLNIKIIIVFLTLIMNFKCNRVVVVVFNINFLINSFIQHERKMSKIHSMTK